MVSKAKGEGSSRDASPNKKSTKETPTLKTYRKSPARNDKRRSPANTPKSPPPSPSRRNPIRKSPSRKSPSRSTKKSPTRSPQIRSRTDPSPTRTDTSPARTTDSPRKPLGRRRKSDKLFDEVKPEKPKYTIRTRRQGLEIDSDSDADLYWPISIEKPKAEVRGRARRLDTDYISPKNIRSTIDNSMDIPNYVGLVKRTFPISQRPEVERVVHLKHSDSSVQRFTEFSDEDDIPVRKSSVRERSERYSEPKIIDNRTRKPEFGGWLGALFIILTLPPMLIGLYLLCDENHCSFTKLPSLKKYKYFSMFIDTTAISIYSGFALLIAILSAFPFAGSKICGLPNKQGKLTYRMNSPFVAVVSGLIVIALEFFGIPIKSYVLQKYFQLLVSSMITGTLLAVYLYVRSYFVPISALNPYAILNSKIYNFCIGRELHPRIFGKIDVKLMNLRIFYIGTMLLNSMYIYESIEFISSEQAAHIFDWRVTRCNLTLLTIASLLIFYCLDYVFFEKTFVTSFSIQYEGVGYFTTIMNYIAIFAVSSAAKYVHDYNISLPVWQLILSVVIFFFGYFLYRASNSQKDAFRQNPYSPGLSYLESIPTSQGKKLLVSGFWGFVRHPNYLGDILVHAALATFVLTKPPVLFYFIDIIYLIQRSHRDGVRCKERYGTAWDRYCNRVKYVLLPKIY